MTLPKVALRCLNPDCGEPVAEGDRFCEVCGQELLPSVPDLNGTAEAAKAKEAKSRDEASRGVRRQRDRVEMWYPGVAGVSDRGLQRTRNEDAIAVLRLEEHDSTVLVVCDGVSTSHQAHVASQVAADTVLAALVTAVEDGAIDLEEAMREAVVKAQGAVSAIPYRAGAKDPPSSTLVAAVVRGEMATVGWVGDSRAYLVCPTGTWQLSRDDTWVAEQVAQGLLSESEASSDPNGHVLTRWLGEDWRESQAASVISFRIEEPGHLVLCSDGLWNYLPTEAALAEAVAELAETTPLGLAAQLTELARQAGGHDNITVAVAAVSGGG
ncbi:MAG TPA: protein phosphatase 2C domain-containing protein [Candidatus Dormibacteraeota bacterium]|nr:protein phosphatase 2C domain-containing protein [Candidatus Dormibacteraeota bacterium]